MIRIERLTKRFGALRAVDDLSLEVREGECLGLVGPNGAGKSTTLKSIVGLVRPTAGRITVSGHDVARAPRAARLALGYLPQGVQFPAGLSAAETAVLYARLRGLPSPDRRGLEALERVGLGRAAGRAVAAFSGGMRQRLGLAVALLGGPPVLVLDEPTVSLDPDASMAIRETLAAERRAGRTLLVSSHLLAELEPLVDRVAVMLGGRLAALGTQEALRLALGLGTRMRLDAGGAADAAARAGVRAGASAVRVEGTGVVMRVAGGHALEILDAVRAVAPVRDVTIEPPRLEDIYRHVLAKGAGSCHAGP